MSKLIHKKVNSFEEYYGLAEQRGISMARQVSKNAAALKELEKNHKSLRDQELTPLPQMIETLKEYIKDNSSEQEVMTLERLTELLVD